MILGASRMAGTLVTRWRSCNRHHQVIAVRMRPRAHLPVLQALSTTRITATCPRLPIIKAPRRILRRAIASRARLVRALIANTIGGGTTILGGLRRTTSTTRLSKRSRIPVTTMVTRRILRATKTTAGKLQNSNNKSNMKIPDLTSWLLIPVFSGSSKCTCDSKRKNF